MQDILWIDTETRSKCDLPKHGSYNYAADKSTQVLIARYAINQGPIKEWLVYKGKAMPADLNNALQNSKVQVRAHGSFERVVALPVLGFKIPLARYYDTSAQMRSFALPGALGDAARALKLRVQKDPRGHWLIRALSIPRSDGTFNDDPVLLAEFSEYCKRDTEVMRALSLGMPQMTDEALATYRAFEAINDSGLPIDGELCELAVRYADHAREEAAAKVRKLTGDKLVKARGTKLTEYIYDKMPPAYKRVMELTKFRAIIGNPGGELGEAGIKAEEKRYLDKNEPYDTLTLDRDTRETIMLLADENPEAFSDEVLELIDAADAAAPASIAKFERMRNMVSSDGYLRGAFVFNGAAQTGRASARGAQVHNFPRMCAKDPEAVLKVMRQKKSLAKFGTTLAVLKSMLRAAIKPPKGKVVRSDWTAIEARGLPWLSGDPRASEYLKAFDDPERDVYIEQAMATGLGENRQGGKVEVLSLGYGGAGGALARIAKSYGVTFPVALPTLVSRWRKANPWAPDFWKALDRAAKYALRDSGQRYKAGRVSFLHQTTANWHALTMRLPCGRDLYYPFPEFDDGAITYLKSAWKPRADATEWPRARLWGGLSAENATQATCASLLRHAVVRMVEKKMPVHGHVHDEALSLASVLKAKSCARDQERIMLAAPDWAEGFPLAVESDISDRFRK